MEQEDQLRRYRLSVLRLLLGIVGKWSYSRRCFNDYGMSFQNWDFCILILLFLIHSCCRVHTHVQFLYVHTFEVIKSQVSRIHNKPIICVFRILAVGHGADDDTNHERV